MWNKFVTIAFWLLIAEIVFMIVLMGFQALQVIIQYHANK